MPALVAAHPDVHVTFNLTPSLLVQLLDYGERDATDSSLELTLTPAERLSTAEREAILTNFFDADWHNQIFRYPRYRELFAKRHAGSAFSAADLRDLQMWFSLAWFGEEFRRGTVALPTGQGASVRRFVEKGGGFSTGDIEDMVAQQLKILRAIVPVHRQLQERGQIEVSTSPFYHPILPLLIDTDRATLDRPGTRLPTRFAHPEDAEAQVALAVDLYEELFGRSPRGMWPAEGAVSQFAIPFFARHGVSWIASDQGVLAQSGRFGYQVDDPEVLCRPYRAVDGDGATCIFFRATTPSDRIGFQLAREPDYVQAAKNFVEELRTAYARGGSSGIDRILTLALDGENAWGTYREDARPFLHALYDRLEHDAEIETVTFSEYLDGHADRGIPQHTPNEQTRVHELFTGSWIDENGSAPGVDLGTWIGEPEENAAWDLLRKTRERVEARATPARNARAYDALYAAEGSDWFWWFGDDQDSGSDEEFDDLFRLHLRNAHRFLGIEAPGELEVHIVPHSTVWTVANPVGTVQKGDRFVIRTNCPGRLHWHFDNQPRRSTELKPVGGVMAGLRRYEASFGPFVNGASGRLHFRFQCTHRDCTCDDLCCEDRERVVEWVHPTTSQKAAQRSDQA
jgi:alpha-amylase/alpha-mannosidase (GH57 family)